MAMMVTPLPPVRSVKTALATTATMAKPPGNQPRTARAAATKRSGVRASANM
jgi:hypothetical protein